METFSPLVLIDTSTLNYIVTFVVGGLVVGILLVSLVYLIGIVIGFGYKLFHV